MQYVAYRNLVDVTHTEAEAKAEAEGVMVNFAMVGIYRFSELTRL